MVTALIGERRDRPEGERLDKIAIHRDTYEAFTTLLYQPFMVGVGWSEFLNRAIARAYEEADEQGALRDRASKP